MQRMYRADVCSSVAESVRSDARKLCSTVCDFFFVSAGAAREAKRL